MQHQGKSLGIPYAQVYFGFNKGITTDGTLREKDPLVPGGWEHPGSICGIEARAS